MLSFATSLPKQAWQIFVNPPYSSQVLFLTSAECVTGSPSAYKIILLKSPYTAHEKRGNVKYLRWYMQIPARKSVKRKEQYIHTAGS